MSVITAEGNTAGKKIRVAQYMRRIALYAQRNNPYKRSWFNNAAKVVQFEQYLGKQLYTDDFDQLTTEGYLYFLRSNPKNPKAKKPSFYKLSTMSIFRFKLNEALERAQKDGFPTHKGHKDTFLQKEDSFTISLNVEEILKVFHCQGLSPEAHAVRERFVISCVTGLRFTDLMRVRAEDFQSDFYKIAAEKGKVRVVIPVHWMIKEIIRRNNEELPPINSQQAFGQRLKQVSRKAGLVDKVLYEQTEGMRFIRKYIPKYKMVSPHTGRRSLATNMYLAGILPKKIMLITGHKTEQSFFKYIRILPMENAMELSLHPFFNTGAKIKEHPAKRLSRP